MARPKKSGIDYFSHDVDIAQDRKIRLIKAKYGLLGYAVYLRLLEELYGETGYYLQLDEEFNLLFCDDNNIDINDYNNMINDYINYGLFDKNIYKRNQILTSRRIQENYISATKRRENGKILEKYDLVNVCNNAVIVDENDTKESKVKESKLNKSKEDIVDETSTPPYQQIISYLNQKIGTSYKATSKATQKLIKARYNEKYTLDDFYKVIDNKYNDWFKTDMEQYLRPQTLFGTKFESYLNQPTKSTEKIEESATYQHLFGSD